MSLMEGIHIPSLLMLQLGPDEFVQDKLCLISVVNSSTVAGKCMLPDFLQDLAETERVVVIEISSC